jgi:hypothetical protein
VTDPRQSRRLPVVIAGVGFTSALALLAGVGAASFFAGDERESMIALFLATAVVSVAGGIVGAPYIASARR